ncbi:MAG: response regulator [Proteobacteria bacterium]|jgi:putative two-component system response regulator|nr:response regulator [Ramlibacter sp.]MCA0214640.1 response regulator [Pseudomonadota bacterium]
MDSEDTSAAARGRIMVVDDDIVATAILRAQLSPHFEVVSTNEPTAALALARESQPHVILCDINMPGMTGDEVANVLSEDEATRDIPIVYLTALLEPGGTGLLDDSFGGHWGVSKSAPLGELLRVIARALQ